MTLPYIAILSVVVFGSAIFLLTRASQELKSSVMNRKIKTATALANNSVTDMLRQFAQNLQENHYDAATLERSPAFSSNGFSSVSITANQSQHFLSFEARGSYGDDIDNPDNRKTVTGVIKFISDMTTFGTMTNGSFTTSANNVTYTGKVWINGNWTISGDNIIVNGGPVFVNGNISTSGGGDLVVNGNLYRAGARAGTITVNGSDNNYLPQMTWPTIDRTYFDSISNVVVSADANVRFQWDGVSPTGSVRVGTTPYAIPSSGFVIYGRNCTLTSSGTVRGRVSVVSLRTSGTVGGNIVIDDTLHYATAGSTSLSNASDSFGAIASNSISFNKAGATANDLYVSGTYFVDSAGTTGMTATCTGCASKRFRFFGTRNKGISVSGWTGFDISFDQNLDTFPPPGLPEKPYLVSWDIK